MSVCVSPCAAAVFQSIQQHLFKHVAVLKVIFKNVTNQTSQDCCFYVRGARDAYSDKTVKMMNVNCCMFERFSQQGSRNSTLEIKYLLFAPEKIHSVICSYNYTASM